MRGLEGGGVLHGRSHQLLGAAHGQGRDVVDGDLPVRARRTGGRPGAGIPPVRVAPEQVELEEPEQAAGSGSDDRAVEADGPVWNAGDGDGGADATT